MLLVVVFTAGLRRGLRQHVRTFAESLAGSTVLHGLFPSLETACTEIVADSEAVSDLLERTQSFRRRLAGTSSQLGGRREK